MHKITCIYCLNILCFIIYFKNQHCELPWRWHEISSVAQSNQFELFVHHSEDRFVVFYVCKIYVLINSSSVVQNENFKFDNEYAESQPDSEEESAELKIDESCDSPPRKAMYSNYAYKPDYGQYEVEVTESWDDISDQYTTFCENQATDEKSELQIVDSLNGADGDTPFSVIINEPNSEDFVFQTLNESCTFSYNEINVSILFDQYNIHYIHIKMKNFVNTLGNNVSAQLILELNSIYLVKWKYVLLTVYCFIGFLFDCVGRWMEF